MYFDTILPDGKTPDWHSAQSGSDIHLTFDITYETADGEHEHVYQTCMAYQTG